jgi:membrane-bound lytic murein transglycosylase D
MKFSIHRAGLLFLCAASIGSAQEGSPDLRSALSGSLSQWAFDPAVLSQLGFDVGKMAEIRTALLAALSSGSILDLAPLRPYAEQALAVADMVPEWRPYAEWLRQRLDYFQVADEVVRRHAPEVDRAESDYEMWLVRIRRRQPPAHAERFVSELKPVFRAAGVPEEMVWLAEVESSFNPAAESPVGARGLYQFMPATAGRFGLALVPEDERLDPYKSAEAAAKYLKILHRRFGSWPLALAAYNAGEGRVGRLLKKTGGVTFDDIAAQLPSETRMYVPKMRAVLHVREGVDLSLL